MGVFIFLKKILNLIPNRNFSLENDLLKKLIKKNKLNEYILNKFFIDIGTRQNLLKAPKLLLKKNLKSSVFLDRVGVINYDYGYVSKFKDFSLKPGVIEGLKTVTKKTITYLL